MAGVKMCSTDRMQRFLYGLSTYAAIANVYTCILSSSEVTPSLTQCTSGNTALLARTTVGAIPTFVVSASGSNYVLTISAASCDLVIQTGNAAYVAIIDETSSVRYLTTVTTQALVVDNKVNVGTWTITINQPT